MDSQRVLAVLAGGKLRIPHPILILYLQILRTLFARETDNHPR
jgi:hypothetical protein